MPVAVGQAAPDFEQDTANGSIRLHQWLDGRWAILFTQSQRIDHAASELAAIAALRPEWIERGVKVLGLFPNIAADELDWTGALTASDGTPVDFPLIADCDGTVSALFHWDAPMHAARCTFVIDPAKILRLVLVTPPHAACDPAAILALLDHLQGNLPARSSLPRLDAPNLLDPPGLLDPPAPSPVNERHP